MARLELTMPQELKDKLIEAAEKSNMSLSEYIRAVARNPKASIESYLTMGFSMGMSAEKSCNTFLEKEATLEMQLVNCGIKKIDFMPKDVKLSLAGFYDEFNKLHGVE